MSSAAYTYQPLPKPPIWSQPSHITRVLCLRPGTGDDPLACDLELVNLNEAFPPYEALSYVWGSEEASHTLVCGSSQLSIKSNLDAALRSLRFKSEIRTLWVDAVCIDQSNLEERSKQVGYMRLVYKSASEVVVWLGPEQSWTKTAFDFANGLKMRNLMLSYEFSFVDWLGKPPSKTEQQLHEEMGRKREYIERGLLEYMRTKPADVDALRKLFDLEYFKRVWYGVPGIRSAFSHLDPGAFKKLQLPPAVSQDVVH
jgi:hypothetical protein